MKLLDQKIQTEIQVAISVTPFPNPSYIKAKLEGTLGSCSPRLYKTLGKKIGLIFFG